MKRRHLLFITLLMAAVFSAFLFAAQGMTVSRSVIVRLKGEDGAAKEVKLYSGSYALLIGVSNYTAGWPRLPGVKKDLEDVEKILKKQGFEVFILRDPDSIQLKAKIESFVSEYGYDTENRLLIYFAGHGHTEKLPTGVEMGYIVPADAPRPDRDRKTFFARALDMQLFDGYAKRIQSKHALFVFDSCFSGSIFAMIRAVPTDITYKTQKPVRQFITSGSAEEAVPDKSVFKEQFVAGIGGEADANGDSYVTGAELGNFLETNVVNYSNNCQHPQYGKIRDPNLDKGDFVFELRKEEKVGASPLPLPKNWKPSSELPAKEYEPVLPSGSGADLSDLKMEAEKNKEAKEKEKSVWADWQKRFQGDVSEAKALESDPNLSAASKKRAWEKILSAYVEDNPLSAEDENLRQYAEGRISALDEKIAEAERLAEEKRQAKEARNAEAERKAEDRRQAEEERQVEAARKAAAKKAASSSAASRPQQVAMGTMPSVITNAKDGSELIMIPAGEFIMGSNDYEDEKPPHRVYLSAYYIGKYEVTNEQFAKFINATGYNARGSWKNYYNSGTADHPVVCVSWNDAQAYCKWASLRLPTEAEWEKAARGTDGRKYPWGDEWDEGRCNWFQGPQLPGIVSIYQGRGPLSVGSFSSGSSPYGCLDMAGNVWEWCADWYGEKYYSQSLSSDPQGPSSGSYRVLRGGSWGDDGTINLRCANRLRNRLDNWSGNNGFRVARTLNTR
ncbi:MAG: SUMF1/EgtB/PvdO family nonheme iron enzyme [bacterium]